MERPLSLPQELENLILDQLIGDHSTLAKFALVSRHWREETRRRFFFTCPVVVAAPWRARKEDLQVQALLQDQNCTFWPYIWELHLLGLFFGDEDSESDGYGEEDRDALNVVLSTLRRLPRLRTLRIEEFDITDTLANLVTSVMLTAPLSHLDLSVVLFEAPHKLLSFLGAFPEPKPRFELNCVEFRSSKWDPKSSPVVSLYSSPSFIIAMDNEVDYGLVPTLILNHNWNVTSLQITRNAQSVDNLRMLGEVIQHIGPSLIDLAFGIRGELADDRTANLISLEHNTSLTTIKVSILGANLFFEGAKPVSSIWMTSLIGSIRSGADFTQLQLRFFSDFDTVDYFEEVLLKSYNWKPVDDMMVDQQRFPTEKAKLSMLILNYREPEETTKILERCLPRLSRAGRLKIEYV